ncbi:MAG: hypothetical protein DMF93_08280 [Acidobacteria bacterium]|nr:MAG: hypothetical protein DMF93_08280 [Acidobacteriota bacterium]
MKPTVGIANASITFTLPGTPGTYYVKLFNASYILVATSGTVTSTVPTVTLNATTVSIGGTVTATVANGPGTPGDWVGLYDANGNNVAWRYLDGTQTLPAAGSANASVVFTLPTTTGAFTVRLYNAQYTWIATSQAVTTTTATVTVNTTVAVPGDTITATVANGPGTPGDWVGLYDANGNPVQWQYLDGTQTLPAVGTPNATVTFTVPHTSGTYDVRFFNASYMLVATSASVAVN